MNKIISIILSTSLLLLIGCSKDEVILTGNIYGIVNDADNGEPIYGAHVTINPSGKTTNTGSDGRYEFPDLDPGQYTIQISKNGYKTNTKRISIIAGEQASGDMLLERGESLIKLSTNTLTFNKNESSKTFEILNIGTSGNVSWSLTYQDSWLNISPKNGTTGQGKNSAIVVKIDRSQIHENTTTNLIIEADGESHSIEIIVEYEADSDSVNGSDENDNSPEEPINGSCNSITSCDSEVVVNFITCIKNGNTVDFQFTLTNNREDWQVWFNRDSSDAIDDMGNNYHGYNIKIYAGNNDQNLTNGNPVYLLKNIKTKYRVVIPNIKDGATMLQRWDLIVSSSQPWSPQTKKIIFEGIKW